ncbi:MAG: Hsp20/alpha crystallin family protein, partial [Atribacterota bacterium]
VIIEAPGVSEEDMKIEVNEDILTFSATGQDRKYHKEILLPGKAKPEPSKTSYKNGIIELLLEKQ